MSRRINTIQVKADDLTIHQDWVVISNGLAMLLDTVVEINMSQRYLGFANDTRIYVNNDELVEIVR
jgi:hypothetical protein